MNFGLYPMLNRYKELKYESEVKHQENSRDFILHNVVKHIGYLFKK